MTNCFHRKEGRERGSFQTIGSSFPSHPTPKNTTGAWSWQTAGGSCACLVGEVPYVVDLQGGYIIPVTDDVDVLEPAPALSPPPRLLELPLHGI